MAEVRRFKAQNRDSRFFGTWKYVNKETKKEVDYSYLFEADGQKIHINPNGARSGYREYYYTDKGILYLLDPGAGIKRNRSITKYDYSFSNNDQVLHLKEIDRVGADALETWIRQKE